MPVAVLPIELIGKIERLLHEMEQALKNERVGALMCLPQPEATSDATAAENGDHKVSL